MSEFEASFGQCVIRLRWPIIVLSILFVTVARSGARFLETDSDSRVFFGPNNPELNDLDDFEAIFARDYNAVIVIEPKDGNVFTRKTLSTIEELTEASWQTPYSRHVDSITTG